MTVYVQLIPAMTSDTAPAGYVASASSVFGAAAAWKAFDQGAASDFWNSDTGVTWWIEIELPIAVRIVMYGILGNQTYYRPKNFELQGWNGASWDTLDSQTDQTSGANQEFKYVLSSPATYSKFRLYITATQDAAGYAAVDQFNLYGEVFTVDPNKVLASAEISAGNWKDTYFGSGTSVELGKTFGLSGTGSLVAESHGTNDVVSSSGGAWNVAGLGSGTAVKSGVTFGLSGTGSLVAESHGSNDIVSTSGGAWDVGTLSGTTVKTSVTYGLGEVGSYAGAGTTAQAATPTFSLAATGDNLTWTVTGTAAGETDPVLQIHEGTSIVAASIQSGQRIRNLSNAGTYHAHALASGKTISEASAAAVAPTFAANRSAGSLGIIYGSSDVVDGTTTNGVAAGTTVAEAGTAYNFDVVFSATDALFSKAGTLTQGGIAYTFSGIFEEIAGQVQTSEGVIIPDGACIVHITKTRIVATPARGDSIYDGARTYDVIAPPTEDPSRKGWVITTKRRF